MTSALNAHGIDRLFKEVGLKFLSKKKIVKKENFKVNNIKKSKKGGCCK